MKYEQNADGLIQPQPSEGVRITSSEAVESENAIMLQKVSRYSLILCVCMCVCLYVNLTLGAPGLKQLLYAGLQMHIDFFEITDFTFFHIHTFKACLSYTIKHVSRHEMTVNPKKKTKRWNRSVCKTEAVSVCVCCYPQYVGLQL